MTRYREYRQGNRFATVEEVGLFRKCWEVTMYIYGYLYMTTKYTNFEDATKRIRQFFDSAIDDKA